MPASVDHVQDAIVPGASHDRKAARHRTHKRPTAGVVGVRPKDFEPARHPPRVDLRIGALGSERWTTAPQPASRFARGSARRAIPSPGARMDPGRDRRAPRRAPHCSWPGNNAGEPPRDIGGIRSSRQIEHRPSRGECLESDTPGDGHANRFRKLEFSARRERHVAAGLEDPLVEAPAIHADVRRTSVAAHLLWLLHDPRQITTRVDIEKCERIESSPPECCSIGPDPRGQRPAMPVRGAPRAPTEPVPDTDCRHSSRETAPRWTHASAASTASAVPSGRSWTT